MLFFIIARWAVLFLPWLAPIILRWAVFSGCLGWGRWAGRRRSWLCLAAGPGGVCCLAGGLGLVFSSTGMRLFSKATVLLPRGVRGAGVFLVSAAFYTQAQALIGASGECIGAGHSWRYRRATVLKALLFCRLCVVEYGSPGGPALWSVLP